MYRSLCIAPAGHALTLAVAAIAMAAVTQSCLLDVDGRSMPGAGGTTSAGGFTGGAGVGGSGAAAGQGGVGNGSPTGGHGGSGGSGGSGASGASGGMGGSGGGGGVQTVEVSIADNTHDAWDDGGSGSLDMCYFSNQAWSDAGGFQFALPVAQGAKIMAAHLALYSSHHGGDTGAYTAVIGVEDTDSAAAFSGLADDIYLRPRISTIVDWDIPDAGLPVGQWSNTPSIVTLVQQTVDRPGWQAGNMVSFAIWGIDGSPGGAEIIVDHSVDPTRVATLHVAYSHP